MRLYVVLGTKEAQVGTRTGLVPTGRMIPRNDPDDLGWSSVMESEMEEKIVPWMDDVPTILGVFAFDPTELCKKKLAYKRYRIEYFEDEDVIKEE